MKNLIFIALLLTTSAFAANSIVILPFTSVSVDSSTVYAVDELFKGELSKAGYKVYMDTSICKDVECAGEIARQRHRQLALFGSLIGMGEKIVVTVYFVRSDGEIAYTDRATANYVEDLDAVVKRITDGFLMGKPVKDAATTENITSNELYEPRRRHEFYTVGSRVGFFVPFYGSKAKEDLLLGVDVIGMYETDRWIVEALVGYHGFVENEAFIPINISGLYMLSNTDFSPYLSFGAGVHILAQSETKMNYEISGTDTSYYYSTEYYDYKLPLISLGGGILLFRTYRFHVTVDARGWFSFLEPWYEGFNVSLGISLKSKPGATSSSLTEGNRDSKIKCCWGF